jgi:hypothetical protein
MVIIKLVVSSMASSGHVAKMLVVERGERWWISASRRWWWGRRCWRAWGGRRHYDQRAARQHDQTWAAELVLAM